MSPWFVPFPSPARLLACGFLSLRACVAVFLLTAASTLLASEERARFNYQLHCQGCHLPEAAGFPGRVPAMKDFAGYFMHSPAGRAYLIRVPGVATSRLPDEELSELMNWLLAVYSAAQMPSSWEPFTAAEVGRLRTSPEADPQATRTRILQNIATAEPALAAQLLEAGSDAYPRSVGPAEFPGAGSRP